MDGRARALIEAKRGMRGCKEEQGVMRAAARTPRTPYLHLNPRAPLPPLTPRTRSRTLAQALQHTAPEVATR